MEIKFLKAGKGDSILVCSGHEYILIDGGDDPTFLFKELDIIHAQGKTIKYLIVTHHDSDHIKGILKLFKKLKNGHYGDPTQFIGRVYFNSPRLISHPRNQESQNLSYRQASTLENYIKELKIPHDNLLTDKSEMLKIGSINIKCLSPTEEILNKYYEKTPNKYLSSYSLGDWNKSLKELEPFINDNSLDTSPSNNTSIVLLLDDQNNKCLLTGDITPERFEAITNSLHNESNNAKIDIDFILLPHHGSCRSVTRKIISKYNCNKYIISTNGKNNYLPNKKTILKVIKYQTDRSTEPTFLFNYTDAEKKLGFGAKERAEYKFKTETENFENGIRI